ncbi:hypothetical protein GCM10010191_81660 [Actinomadura vinacea]|uniref:Alpha/beta hydrolase fold-3 domain-containing protein n=1 Tax=Actinomadura vinacea TaxID=115336 RepID=A0ABN3KA84_9ACTN
MTYASRIWQAGGVAELHVWPGGFHGFGGMAPDAAISRQAVAAQLNGCAACSPPRGTATAVREVPSTMAAALAATAGIHSVLGRTGESIRKNHDHSRGRSQAGIVAGQRPPGGGR